ncbi:MAG: PDZ domain-containing protein [Acidimicrobiaceae bacterium]|nr:PDZ domain-containing protein [Acidimicrobiaceae bacterium]
MPRPRWRDEDPSPHSSKRWRPLRSKWIAALSALTVLTIAVTLLNIVPVRWFGQFLPGEDDPVAFLPGSAIASSHLLEIEGAEVFDPEGEILVLTVSIDSDLDLLEWLRAAIDDDVELHDRRGVFGDRSETEQRQFNRLQMTNSIDSATIVALERLGFDVADFTGVQFVEVLEDGPSVGRLEAGEVIRAINGEPTDTVASLRAVLAELQPGDSAVVTVESLDGENRRDVEITLGSHPEHGGPFIGLAGITERVEERQLPFDVGLDLGAVGGPSAGLAFTLIMLDVLTPGELTAGKRVAVTGSIRVDETVGDVGGVAQKAVAARQAGAELIIVPEASLAEARAAAGEVAVVGVSTLGDALQALRDMGGQAPQLPAG